NSEIAKKTFNDFSTNLFNSNEFDIAKGKMISFFTLLFAEMEKFNNETIIKSDYIKEIIKLKTFDEWREWIDNKMLEVFPILENNHCSAYPQPLIKAINYLEDNYNKQLQLSSVAEECKVSASYLSHLFSNQMDINFIDYLNQLRLNKAIELLQEGELSIKEISWTVGYHDPNYFSRVFRKNMGFSPSNLERKEFLKRHQQ
ncbi:MAG: AraC family transcriptional regulator, partial [Spirochaetales bacterium]|nr:AraC family transcriptional regulator [Spirochaetales bacterium]